MIGLEDRGLGARSKSDLGRETETCTKHSLCGGNIPDLVDEDLAVLLRIAWREEHSNLLVDALADVVQGGCIVRLDSEAVDVNQRKLRLGVRGEELFVALVQAAEVVKKLYS